MKKLFTSIALSLLFASASLASEPAKTSTANFERVYEKVSNVYTLGTDAEKSAENKKRAAILAKYPDYTLDCVKRVNGVLFVVLVKAVK